MTVHAMMVGSSSQFYKAFYWEYMILAIIYNYCQYILIQWHIIACLDGFTDDHLCKSNISLDPLDTLLNPKVDEVGFCNEPTFLKHVSFKVSNALIIYGMFLHFTLIS